MDQVSYGKGKSKNKGGKSGKGKKGGGFGHMAASPMARASPRDCTRARKAKAKTRENSPTRAKDMAMVATTIPADYVVSKVIGGTNAPTETTPAW